jgi:LacI family transcriptional regulator
MKQKNADIIAVAKAARVSPSTVSRSFNHPELVKPGTRVRIDAAVRKLGYIRNRAAQSIHGIRTATIGLIVPTIDHTIFAELVQNFSDTVEEDGFTILLATHGYSLKKEYGLVRKMLEHRVDGIALIGLAHDEDTYALIETQGIPSVLLWNHGPDARLPCIGSSNLAAGRLIASHVIAKGHRDVALLFPPIDDNDRAADRLTGVQQVLDANGVDVRPARRFETRYSIADAKEETARLFCASDKPDVIICGNDVLAWGAIHAATATGIAVPHDVSITGIGDFKGSRDIEPGLTTVRLPAREIGASGGETLKRAITEPGTEVSGKSVEPVLCERGSCIARL